MVSRSLEKMILVALGLTTVVLVGMPVLLFAIDAVDSTQKLDAATNFADRVHNLTARVNQGELPNITVQINVPSSVNVTSEGAELSITYTPENYDPITWAETYNRGIHLTAPEGAGVYVLTIRIESYYLSIIFSPAL